MEDGSLLEGLYESLITHALEKRLADISSLGIHRAAGDHGSREYDKV